MDGLDIPTHQLILDDLASNLAESASRGQLTEGDTQSIFGTGALSSGGSSSDTKLGSVVGTKLLAVSAAQTQIALANFAASIASASHTTEHTLDDVNDVHLVPVLEHVLHALEELPNLHVEERIIAAGDWPLADQLAYALSAGLIRIAKHARQHRTRCISAVTKVVDTLVLDLAAISGNAHDIATHIAPLYHGVYRAIAGVAFPWSLSEFAQLTAAMQPLSAATQVTRRLNDALLILTDQEGAAQQAGRATRRKPKQPTVRPVDDPEDEARSTGSVDTFFSGDEDVMKDDTAADDDDGFIFENDDDDARHYRTALLSQYRQRRRPLSGHFILCASTQGLASVLAQALAVFATPPIDGFSDYQKGALEQDKIDPARTSHAERFDIDSVDDLGSESAATHEAWKALLRFSVRLSSRDEQQQGSTTTSLLSVIPGMSTADKSNSFSGTVASGISSATRLASRMFHDMQRFIESESYKQSELFVDLYALETLSEALKLSALASVAQTQLTLAQFDNHTLVRIRTLLSDHSFIYDPIVQGSAIQSTSLLVRNYPNLALPMTTTLRRLVSLPLAIFELVRSGQAAPSPVLAAAAKCLATCVTVGSNKDLAVSTMYSLLNSLGGREGLSGAVGGAAGGAMSVRSGMTRGVSGRDFSVAGGTMSRNSPGPGGVLQGKTDEQRRLIQVNTIAFVSRLALEIGDKEITALAVSLFLQRLRTADEATEAAILNSIVPLALASPRQSYVDVLRALSQVSRAGLTGGAGRRSNRGVQSAQLRLAHGLGRLDEHTEVEATESGDADLGAKAGRKELYLVELLQLFVEKGLQIQTSSASNQLAVTEEAELKSDLQSLLPVISATLSHPDINPQLDPRVETVSLFRNMWFLATMFGMASASKPRAATPFSSSSPESSHLGATLGMIALKTPTLVPETAQNYVESELKFNSVLKREYPSKTLESQRKLLSSLMPNHVSELRSFGLPQITFLTTIYHLECLRSTMGMPSMILWYFVNQGLNTSSLVAPMQNIADKVMDSFIDDLSYQVQEHALDTRASTELKNLLMGSCHRVEKVRAVSQRFLDRLIQSYPSLLCDEEVVVAMLEMLTLLRQACEGQYRDEYYPVYHFSSERSGINFDMSDSYAQRNEILSQFYSRTRRYLSLVLSRAPVELQGILQRYLGSFDDGKLPLSTELGKSVAIEYARALPSASSGVPDAFLPDLGGWKADASSGFVNELSSKSTYLGEMTGIHLALTKGLVELQSDPDTNFSPDSVRECKIQLAAVAVGLREKKARLNFADLRRLLYRSAALTVALDEPDFELLHFIVSIPLRVFTPSAITTASHVWTWIIGERPAVETKIMVEITLGWSATIKERRGLFSKALDIKHPLLEKTEMTPSDRLSVTKEREQAARQFGPHLTLLQLLSSRFEAFRYRHPSMVLALVRLIQRSGSAASLMSRHPLSRELRFTLVVFGLRILQSSRLDGLLEHSLRTSLYHVAFDWFAVVPQWSFGSSRLQIAADMQLLTQLIDVLQSDVQRAPFVITSFPPSISGVRMPGHRSLVGSKISFAQRRDLLILLVQDELNRLKVWNNPLNDSGRGSPPGDVGRGISDIKWSELTLLAWKVNPSVAVHMIKRFKAPAVRRNVAQLVRAYPSRVADCADALDLMVEDHLSLARKQGSNLNWLLYWADVTPVEAITLFLPEYGNDPYLLQYAMRALEEHPVDLTFFYVPQLVQALRDDEHGYVAQFIFETSKISQLFCHQIIWNMKANSYKDDDAEEPDPMKPQLDRMTDLIVDALSGEAQDFYDREFGFFNEVTSISGKLKPFIKKSKAEKKAKIDEEMGKIKVDPGVYLPSNPDGVVVDLARKSGRPLQSHAKAPFMATFKVRRDVPKDHASGGKQDAPTSGDDVAGTDTAIDTENVETVPVEVWQAAIFKVGDDCRQDVLALQAIAMLKNIWQGAGLDLYLNPYRVTATGPGCGVIDVVPNATSRDEMGRAQINDLNAFFLQRFGNVDSVSYQQARFNFIKSMAGYSLACHLLQIRDRHNGNIMIDGEGHLVHIDFGFLFEIGPGGMRFEPFSFKLSLEFIEVMGGDTSQGYRLFSELLVKGFLALRPYTEDIIALCRLMYGTDLPSFKGMATFDHLRDRFKPHLNEREAADHAIALIANAHTNRRAVVYDQIQYLQNSIPFRK